MSTQRYNSVWDALEDTPGAAENMKVRSILMQGLAAHIKRCGMSQSQAAHLLGVTQPRISDLTRGRIDLFSIDALVNMATAAGLGIEVTVREGLPPVKIPGPQDLPDLMSAPKTSTVRTQRQAPAPGRASRSSRSGG